MSRIRVLPDHLANQIAAGEVVERPASVVKELLENSIDAGATRMEVRVEGGGVGLIRVSDNGCGMDEDDLLLALERHATSKLRSEEDLLAIRSLGFRGEALPSIASVSRLAIISRPPNRDMGTRVELRHGVLRTVQATGCARGTVMEVRDLFGNVPARRKFLKSRRTELWHMEEAVRGLALARPGLGFSFQADGREVLALPPDPDLETRFRAVFALKGKLLPLRGTGLRGFLLEPHAPPGKVRGLRILVNGRVARIPALAAATAEAMSGYLMQGRKPAGLLALDLDPAEVDVNVHPAKTEVRLRDLVGVRGRVTAAVRAALEGMQVELRQEIFAPSSPGREEDRGPDALAAERPSSELGEEEAPYQSKDAAGPGRITTEKAAAASAASDPGGLFSSPAQAGARPLRGPAGHGQGEDRAALAGPRIIGVFQDLYLLCESNDSLVVIDQHAAHERILFERLRRRYASGPLDSQVLLTPCRVELAPRDQELLERHGRELERLGLCLEPFGGDTWIITAVPALLRRADPQALLAEALDSLRAGARGGADGLLERSTLALLARMACRAAVKGGDELGMEEIQALLQAMEDEAFSHCPHGRPVLRRFPAAEIRRWFERG